MGWNGSGTVNRTDGTRSGAAVWTDALAADEDVNAQDHDTHDEDIADAIENCVAKDGQNTPTANLPMGGYKHTGAGSATANGQYIIFDQFAWTAWTPTLSASGSMTYTSTTINFAKYIEINDIVYFKIDITGTVGGTPGTHLKFTLPVTAINEAVGGGATILDDSVLKGGFYSLASTTQFDVYKYDASNYVAGTARYIINGFYQAA